MDTNRDSAHQSRNEDNFATFSLRLEFLNEAEKEKNNGKGDLASAPSRFASQTGEMQQSLLILLSVFRVGFDAQFHRLCYKTIGSCFYLCTIELRSTWEVLESTQEARVALGYRLGQLLRFFSPNFPRAPYSTYPLKRTCI